MNINEYSFSSLFGKHTAADGKQFEINEIEIPIIQSDSLTPYWMPLMTAVILP